MIAVCFTKREGAVRKFLSRAETDWPVVHKRIEENQLVETEYGGKRFYMRKLHGGDEL